MTQLPSSTAQRSGTDAVRETFDEWVRTGKANGMERRHRRLAERMLERVDLPGDGRVLELGCGDGWLARMLSQRLPEGAFVGIDVSSEMILRARLLCGDSENVLFAPGEAEQIPWAEEYFTHLISIESAYYWADLGKAAHEMYRVAAKGGTFHVLINYFRENTFSAGWGRDMGLQLHRLGADQWADTFRDAGFSDVATEQIPDDSPISPGKTPEELARREGLQRVGALHISGRKIESGPSPDAGSRKLPNPFRVLRGR